MARVIKNNLWQIRNHLEASLGRKVTQKEMAKLLGMEKEVRTRTNT
jgi:DNA-directed RNA polymerase specialized sigma subunit